MTLSFNADVRRKFDNWIYPALLTTIILYQWLSEGLSLVTQGIIQGDARMSSKAWYYHRMLDLPGGASVWWGIFWLLAGLSVFVALFLGLRTLMITLCAAALVPLSWMVLFFMAALHDSEASFSGCVVYLTLTLLAVVTGLGLQGKVGLDYDTKTIDNY